MSNFDMPPMSAGFDARGGWLVNHLVVDLAPLSPVQASAIPGNFGGESGLDPNINERAPIVPGSRGGFGWEQATGGRRVALEQWATDNGLDVGTDEADYGFLIHELTTTEAHALDRLRLTTTIETAVYTFEVLFERPSNPQGGLASRVHFAQRALAAAAQLPPPPGPTLPAAPPTPAPGPQLGTPDVLAATVRLLQTVLDVAGYYTGPVDGHPNDGTAAALDTYAAWLDAAPGAGSGAGA